MSSKKVLGHHGKSIQKIQSQNFDSDLDLSLKDKYFVNLNIVNTSKGIAESEEERQKFQEIQKFHASRANQECSENYLATTIAQLSRRDRVPGNKDSCGSFTEVSPIVNKSINRVLIYGSPGTGKTTLCKKIVHEFYNKDLWNHLDEVIWIPLRQLKDSKFDQDQMDEEKLLKIFLNEENLNLNLDNVLFILDGWDEIQDLISDSKKAKLVECINKIMARKNLILTSRPYVQLNFAEYQRVLEITGFNDKNVRDYIKTILEQNNRLSDQGKIMEYIDDNLLADLVTIPIILEIFLFTWEEISVMDKNDITTTKLYETFILKLSKQFLVSSGKDVSKDVTFRELINGPLRKEFKMLRDMAKKWLEDGSLQFIYADFDNPNEKLEQKLPFLTSTSTYDWKHERSEFIHLTFLEFFAAFELINRVEDDFRQFVAENKFNPKYFVVFTFVAGLIDADLHNLKEFSEVPYRCSKDEKLDLYFDYLQSDPVDLSGKYIYMLLVDCLHECQLSKLRKTSIYEEIAIFSSKMSWETGINGFRVLYCLRRFPLGMLEVFLKYGVESMYMIYNYKYKFPQFTDSQVEKIFKSKTLQSAKLEILCKQCSFSPYSSDAIRRLLSFESLCSNRLTNTYSNLPFPVLEKVVKLLVNKDLFESGYKKKFNKYKGISCTDAIKLCGQLVDIENDESIRDIIVKLALSDVDEEILFFLENVYEFVEEIPGALLGILNSDNIGHDKRLYKRVMKLVRLFDANSPALVEKLLQILTTDEKLKYQTLKTITNTFYKKEMPADVAFHVLIHFKSIMDSEKERLRLQNRLIKDYLVSMDRKSRAGGFWWDWKIKERTYSLKEFINSFKSLCNPLLVQQLIDLFLGTPVNELGLEILKKEERNYFKIFPFIVETKTQDGNLHIKTAISNIINSKKDSLRQMVHTIALDLICETIKELLEDITGKERNADWRWTLKRIFYTLTEIHRYSASYNSQQKCAPKYGDEKCVHHAHLVNSEVLRELFDSEDIKLDKTIESAIDAEEDLLQTMMYICYEQNSNDGNLLWQQLLNCGIEDSDYQEKVTEHIINVFCQEIEVELRAELLYHLSQRVHRLTKKQLTVVLKHEGDKKDYELGEDSNEDRIYLSVIAKRAEASLIANHKFIKDCEYFSEDEQSELRKLSRSYDRFCREESDLEILQQIEELSSQINETLNRSTTKEILNVISEYLKDSDISKFNAKVTSICPEMSGYQMERYPKVANIFLPETYAKQDIVARYILDSTNNPEFKNLKVKIEKITKKSFSFPIIHKIYEKLNDEILGAFFLKVLKDNSNTSIISMLKCINDSSTERQKFYMTYALVQSLIGLNDNLPVYIFNNDLYMGSSVSENPALPNLNQHQRDILFNTKSFANTNGFNIQLRGIAPNVESFKICAEKCTVMDLSEKEELLKNKKHLDLSNQNIKETKEMEKIRNFIKKYPVETLILSNNQITGEMFEILIRDASETRVKYLIMDSNHIDLDKFDFGQFFGDEDSYVNQNEALLLLDISNNSTSIGWLENFEKFHDAKKFIRKDTEGKIVVHGYNLNNANVILYRSGLNREATAGGKCKVM